MAEYEHDPKELEKMKVTTLDDPETLCRVLLRISSGCLPLDHVLGGSASTGWGWPVRRMVEVYGDNSTGKSMLGAQLCGETQHIGGMAGYADVEVAQDPTRMEVLGINPKTIMMCYPRTVDEVIGELRLQIAYKNKKIGKDAPLTFVWDSVAGINTIAELEKGEKEGTEGKQYPDVPRAISQSIRQLINEIAENNVLFFLTNQTRQKLGVMFGDGVTTTGGMALRFYSSVRVEMETAGKIKDGTRIIGANVRATTVKNRLAIPYQTLMLPVYYKYGVNEAEATFDWMVTEKLIGHEKGAVWYTLTLNGQGEQKFQKKDWMDLFTEHTAEIVRMVEGMG